MEKVIHSIVSGLHILAVVTWIGSMIYSQLAVTPALRTALGSSKFHAVTGLMMKRFLPLTWTSLAVVVATGLYNIVDKKDNLLPLSSGPGSILLLKLILVAILIVILFLQVFLYGPKMKKLVKPSTPKSSEMDLEMSKIEQTTKAMSWWHLGIGIAIVILGVILSQLLD